MRRAPIHDGLSDAAKSPALPSRTRWWTFPLGAVLGLALATVPTVAQSPGLDPEVARQNAVIVATLVRTILVALHQANVTGNYTVLRDLAAPSFRDRNTSADLARIFAPIRGEKIDIGSVVVLEPHLTASPFIDDNRMLRIEGTFPTEPTAIRFQLLYQAGDDGWRLFGISIAPARPDAVASTGEAPVTGSIGQNTPPPLSGSLVPPIPKPRPQTAPQQ